MFAREYNDSDLSFKEGDDERAPNYVVTPSAAKVNRLFVVGVATEVDEVGDDYYRVRVSDPTGTFMVYAGQYQPDALSFFRELQPPEYVSVVGKSRTYQPEDSDDVYTSIRPEEVNTADEDTRDRWNLEAARQTIQRAEAMQMYLKGDGSRVRGHRPRLHDAAATVEHYDLTLEYLEDLRKDAYQVVAELAGVDADLSELQEVEVDAEAEAAGAEPTDEDEAADAVEAAAAGADADTSGGTSEAASAEPAAEPADETADETSSEADAAAETLDAEPAEPEPEAEAGEPDAGVDSEDDDAEAGEAASEAAQSPAEPEATEAAGGSDASDLEEEFADVDSEDAEWEWDEGERERVEEEYGGEFDTAAELESEDDESTAGDAAESTSEADARELGEAEQSEEPLDDVDDEPPASAEAEAEVEPGRPADSAEEPDAEDTDLEPEAAADMAEESADSAETTEADAAAEDADAEAVVMEVLEEHDDGDGVSRGDIRSYAGERGVSEEAAEEAIEQLLLEGMCYPSDGDRIKPL